MASNLRESRPKENAGRWLPVSQINGPNLVTGLLPARFVSRVINIHRGARNHIGYRKEVNATAQDSRKLPLTFSWLFIFLLAEKIAGGLQWSSSSLCIYSVCVRAADGSVCKWAGVCVRDLSGHCASSSASSK
jgi:hypothetical protein